VEKRPVRVYLDQKDFSRIGKGLQGSDQCEGDLIAYYAFKDLVKQGKARFYFSIVHFIEALRYDDEKINLLKPYCEAVDTLTKGHCFKWPRTIEQEELDAWLHRQTNNDSAGNSSCPFGKGLDAFPKDSLRGLDLLPKIRANLRDACRKLPPIQGMPLALASQNDELLKRMILQMPDSNYDSFIRDSAIKVTSRRECVEMLFGDPDTRKKILDKTFGTFSSLIPFSRDYPAIKKAGLMFDSSAETVGKAITFLRDFSGQERMDPKKHHDDLVVKIVDSQKKKINEFCGNQKIDEMPLLEQLTKTALDDLPSLAMVIEASTEYYRLHRASPEKGRKPKQSDIADIAHARHLPYVDIFCCDGFFANVLSGCKKRNVKVITRISEVPNAIEQRYETLAI